MDSSIQMMVMGMSHRTAPVEVREKFAVPESEIRSTLESLVGSGDIREGVLVSTCNRVELYFATARPELSKEFILKTLIKKAELPSDLSTHFYKHTSPVSVQHLFEVCAGLDSMVVGETEILGQIKEFYRIAQEAQCTGALSNRLFQSAFSTAKKIRSQTKIGMGSVSVGSVAADLASQIFGNLKDRSVLLVGAGEMSETTAKALQSRGAQSLMIANRSFDRAARLAEAMKGLAIPWETLYEACQKVDVIVSSTSSPQPILTRHDLEPILKGRNGTPLFMIDIAVPRDIDREVSGLPGVYLYDIDDLQVIADQNLAMRQQEIAVCKQIVRSQVDQFNRWFTSRMAFDMSGSYSPKWSADRSSGLASA